MAEDSELAPNISLRPTKRPLSVEEEFVENTEPVIETTEPVIETTEPVVEGLQEENFKLTFSPVEFMDYWDSYTEEANQPGARIDSAAQGFANGVVTSLLFDPVYNGRMTYNSLRKGTAPILKDLGLEGKSLSDEQIIRLFAEDDEGERIEINPGYIEGVKRRALGGSAGTAGFFAGMKLGNLAVAGVPPVTPITAAVRIGVPIVTGMGGYVVGSVLGDKATDVLMGDEPIVIPGSASASYQMGKATPEVFGFAATPWLAGIKGINLGGAIAVNNTRNFIGPIISSTGVTKTPISSKAVAGIENVVNRMGAYAYSNPYRTAFVEAGAGAISLGGTYGAQSVAPDNPWIRFAGEAGGGLLGAFGADLIVNRTPFLWRQTGGRLYDLYKRKTGQAPSVKDLLPGGMTENELTDAGNFIIEQLEKNNENPAELFKLINDPEFDKWLVGPDGNKIQLDPATRSASITLLSLQNQFLDANTGLNKDAGKKMQDSIEALRRALLAMYADGSKSSLADAAATQIDLFEATLASKLAAAFQATESAFKTVRPDGENVDLSAANKIFELLDSQYTAGRKDEQSLWRIIPRDIEINSYVNEEGVTTNTPNFISVWNRLIDAEPEGVANDIMNADELLTLGNFVKTTTKELGLSSTDATPPPVLPEQRRLTTALDKIAGTNNAKLPSQIVETMTSNGDSLEDILAALRTEAGAKRGKFSTPRTKEVANALDAQANFLIAQQRQASEFAQQAAADGTDKIGLNAYDLVRYRSRALNMGKRLAAAHKQDESRWAYEMADAFLADLNGLDIGVSQAYDTARSFSRAFNDVFTRAYAGEVLGTKKNGAPKISIETIANRMMTGDGAFMKAAQLNGIANYQITQSLTTLLESSTRDLLSETGKKELKTAGKTLLEDFQSNIDQQSGVLDMDLMRQWYGRNEELIKTIPGLNTRISDAMNQSVSLRTAEETLLRTVRADALNPDGTLNTSGLSDWMSKANNKRLLKLFPALELDLNNVEKARNVLEATKKSNVEEEAAFRNGIGLYELLPDKTSNPTTTISLALSDSQNTPFTIMNKYMNMINDVGEDGFTVTLKNSPNKGQTWSKQELKDGLRTTIYETMLNASSGKRFRPDVAYNRLFAKHPNGEISVAEWMKSNGIIGEAQLKDTRRFLRKMAEIEAFTMKAKPGQTDEFFKDIGEGIRLLAAMGGSAAGTNLKRILGFESGVGDLVVAGRGARFGQNLVEKYMAELPSNLQASRVGIILENPKLLKLVLKTGRSEREKNLLLKEAAEAFERNYVVQFARRVPGSAGQIITEESTDLDGEIITNEQISPVVNPTNNQSNLPASESKTAPVVAPKPSVIEPPSRFNNNAPVNNVPSRFNNQQSSIQNSGPVDRERFAALFPNDSTTQLMKSGIGSLA